MNTDERTDELFGPQNVVHHTRRPEHPPFQRGSATSEAAAEAIKPVTGRLRKRVFEEIAGRGEYGATRQEVENELGLSGDTVRPRWMELARAGLIEDSGNLRATTSKRLAEVWRVTRAGVATFVQSAP